MKINKIKITNVRGIKEQEFEFELFPNKPNLLVASNGFGKSSIAVSFASLQGKSMKLTKEENYQCNDKHQPELILTMDNGTQYKANCSQNEITECFDVTVISSGLISKATKQNTGKFTIATASLEIQPIIICKIPDQEKFSYKYATARSSFGNNGKILPNIDTIVSDTRLYEDLELQTIELKSKQLSQIKAIIDKINKQNGKTDDICKWINENLVKELNTITPLKNLATKILELKLFNSTVEALFAAYQILMLYGYDKKKFKNAVKWFEYCSVKDSYTSLLEQFRSSDWNWACVMADKKKKTLSIKFPPAHQLSNGQRDIITLAIQMHKTLYTNSKKSLILVIDEVFDYLDDANLVAFQYYLTSLIEKYKNRNQTIYPIVLTHLDPGVFFDFCFNRFKIKIHYLQSKKSNKGKDSLRLIEAREKNNDIKETLEKHWFHYHPDDHEIEITKWSDKIRREWKQAHKFHSYTAKQLEIYLKNSNNEEYDPLAICFAVRIQIEKNAYDLLSSDECKEKFIDTHTTTAKLDYVATKYEAIPESYFLLGLIYNNNLHWREGKDYISSLVPKLNHPIIKTLIKNIGSSPK